MTKYKHIICCGCSFTRQQGRLNLDVTENDFLNDDAQFYRWVHYLSKRVGGESIVYNLGNPTNDNSVIRKGIIYKIKKLIDEGVNTDDIFVFTQWSSWQRNSFFISEEMAKEYNSLINDKEGYTHISDFITEKKYNGQFGYYLLTGGFMVDHVSYNVKKLVDKYGEFFYSKEESLIRFFENILFLQSFLKSKKINYLCFNLQNNFSHEYTSTDGFPLLVNDENNNYKSIYVDKYITKTDNKIQYGNPYIQHLYEMVDFDNFWFFKNQDTSHGGLMEWSIKRYDIDSDTKNEGLWQEWSYMSKEELKKQLSNTYGENGKWELGHPSSKMNEIFCDEVLLDYVK